MRYEKEERETPTGAKLKTILHSIPKIDLLIWGTDNNGQIEKRDTTLQEEQHTAHNGIGKWHYGKTTQRGNGDKMVKMIELFKLEETNTAHPPKKDDAYNLMTWKSGGGEIRRHLDYILIRGNVETWPNYTKVKGVARPKQGNQQRILKMETRAKFKYPKKTRT